MSVLTQKPAPGTSLVQQRLVLAKRVDLPQRSEVPVRLNRGLNEVLDREVRPTHRARHGRLSDAVLLGTIIRQDVIFILTSGCRDQDLRRCGRLGFRLRLEVRRHCHPLPSPLVLHPQLPTSPAPEPLPPVLSLSLARSLAHPREISLGAAGAAPSPRPRPATTTWKRPKRSSRRSSTGPRSSCSVSPHDLSVKRPSRSWSTWGWSTRRWS
mmetsp:Transcript_5510/g.19180  ORF Transcript_5510/g.19180 Transcript_5510/m.19180 type:complete len:211 (-) Transcript_5510:441-1073(-)